MIGTSDDQKLGPAAARDESQISPSPSPSEGQVIKKGKKGDLTVALDGCKSLLGVYGDSMTTLGQYKDHVHTLV